MDVARSASKDDSCLTEAAWRAANSKRLSPRQRPSWRSPRTSSRRRTHERRAQFSVHRRVAAQLDAVDAPRGPGRRLLSPRGRSRRRWSSAAVTRRRSNRSAPFGPSPTRTAPSSAACRGPSRRSRRASSPRRWCRRGAGSGLLAKELDDARGDRVDVVGGQRESVIHGSRSIEIPATSWGRRPRDQRARLYSRHPL